MRRSTRILLFLSLFIAVSDGTFVFINYRSAKKALNYSLERQGEEYRQAFQLSLQDLEKTMALMATFVSNDPRVQDLFQQGVQAVREEGGGPGGPRTAALRQELYQLVQPSWQEVTARYKVRQLHFHLGPGSTSFLRVHKAGRFGDNMDRCRYTVVAVNDSLETVTGFETGRVVSGIRGVVPMFGRDPVSGARVHTGALEAGTSFSTILPDLAHTLQAGLAVLLTEQHVKQNVWPEMMARAFKDTTRHEGFYLEASIGPARERILASGILASLQHDPGTRLVHLDGVPSAVTGFPLRDFRASRDPGLPPVGMVLIWTDATGEVAAFQQAVWTNIFYAMMGFCVVEILLFLAVHLITRHLERTILQRTRQLHAAQDKLVDNARQVGMAEVATEVLHNVGNVLNSVKIAVSQLRERIDRSKVHGVARVAGLLDEQEDNLSDFLTGDERGRQVPRYLTALAENLEGEQQANLVGLAGLQDHIDHITRIISSQQDKVRGGSLIERVQVVDLLHKALEINEACLETNGIATCVQTTGPAAVEIDRHRVLQILVNLTRNAAQSLAQPGAGERLLTLRAVVTPDNLLQITVQDSGAGIAPQDLDRIFQHGFTTKKNGHGFGLHSSANAAAEMGGSLQAHSEGRGRGASFVLEVPVLNVQEVAHV